MHSVGPRALGPRRARDPARDPGPGTRAMGPGDWVQGSGIGTRDPGPGPGPGPGPIPETLQRKISAMDF